MSPTGTNLLHFGQAKEMLEHCMNGGTASVGSLPPHQQQLLDDKLEADIQITRLDEFIQRNALFRQLDPVEQARMRRQLDVMRELSVILGERIASF
ncbi:crAss001_48 related protein [Comamonas thiooxydans]|uniref:crAss001_48 related protein n=1 Tax=Comamonas thiooxydans TaxID=363952 RepID=UPI00050E10A4|nr:hypothetical protein [Comamonas thiooxydans]KGG90912.1 hypothetical protein P369_13960 [Comamonas thiooxydans]KGG98261.1 hypothetical protein P367_13310 [Comamonas thiooxydans]KGH03060.1 hypothetical protein P365_17575 [Comamonas thiooxydans]KGH10720.1 hypothetical protein P368_15650 [Comamonas thiooxydans]TZG06630.1 hypothetical protein FZC30_22810 [Comamonas thiooxydans]